MLGILGRKHGSNCSFDSLLLFSMTLRCYGLLYTVVKFKLGSYKSNCLTLIYVDTRAHPPSKNMIKIKSVSRAKLLDFRRDFQVLNAQSEY